MAWVDIEQNGSQIWNRLFGKDKKDAGSTKQQTVLQDSDRSDSLTLGGAFKLVFLAGSIWNWGIDKWVMKLNLTFSIFMEDEGRILESSLRLVQTKKRVSKEHFLKSIHLVYLRSEQLRLHGSVQLNIRVAIVKKTHYHWRLKCQMFQRMNDQELKEPPLKIDSTKLSPNSVADLDARPFVTHRHTSRHVAARK